MSAPSRVVRMRSHVLSHSRRMSRGRDPCHDLYWPAPRRLLPSWTTTGSDPLLFTTERTTSVRCYFSSTLSSSRVLYPLSLTSSSVPFQDYQNYFLHRSSLFSFPLSGTFLRRADFEQFKQWLPKVPFIKNRLVAGNDSWSAWLAIAGHSLPGGDEYWTSEKQETPPEKSGPAETKEKTSKEESKESSDAAAGSKQEGQNESDPAAGAENEKSQKDDSEQKNKNVPPHPDDDYTSTYVALALLLFLVASNLSGPDDANATEITFVDFRNKILRHTDKVQIVNGKKARVFLRADNAMEGSTITSSGSSSDTHEPTNFRDDSIMAFPSESSGTPSTNTTTSLGIPRKNSNKARYYFNIGSIESFEEKLAKAQAHLHPEEWVEVQYIKETNWPVELLKVLPYVIWIAALYSVFRAAGSSVGGPGGKESGIGRFFSMNRSTAKRIKPEDVNVTFADVAGCQQAKMEIMEFVDFLKDSERFTKLGAKIPKGALLSGPPGTGKTLLAKAVAGEAGVPFFSISGSDFLEMFVGVGPSRVRNLFKDARASAPCIVFIDEIDAVGRQRGRGAFSGGSDERENTLNQLLVEMDGFSSSSGVVVIAGTNRADILDQALLRPGRFDRQIFIDRPDLQGRKEIFEVHLKEIKLEGTVKDYASKLAGLTPGFAGADIANICNEAAIVAARRRGTTVSLKDFEVATDRVIGGLESNKIMSSEERNIVAHHEAGHAIAGWFLEHADPLLKVTIIPRSSGALGFAQYLPKEVFLRSQEQLMDIVCMTLAGRAAEDVFFGRVTTGASDDLKRVTKLVYGMIKTFGMNSRLGQLVFPERDNNSFGDKPYSEDTAEAMDDEARKIVDEAYQRTVELIRKHRDEVGKLANLLLEKETITHDDITDLVGPRPFQGDTAYQEFVSNRKKDRDPSDIDESPKAPPDVTPGLAISKAF